MNLTETGLDWWEELLSLGAISKSFECFEEGGQRGHIDRNVVWLVQLEDWSQGEEAHSFGLSILCAIVLWWWLWW